VRHQAGFNLLELMTTLVVLAVSVSIGVPSAQNILNKNRLVGASEAAYSHLRLLRAEAVRHNRIAYVNFAASDGTWSYGFDDAAACDASVAGDCTVDGNERRIRNSDYPGVSASTSFAAGTSGFEPRRGMALNSGQISFNNSAGRLNVVVTALGTVRLCTVAGAEAVRGYPQC
jgi:prepilin-type N-terminal cleavage/methylation domain-containing protein